MKQSFIFVISTVLLVPLVHGDEDTTAPTSCEMQKNIVAGTGIMARIPFNENLLVIYKGKLCVVNRPFEVFITFSGAHWLLTTTRDGNPVSWKHGQESVYKKEDATVRPLEPDQRHTAAARTKTY